MLATSTTRWCEICQTSPQHHFLPSHRELAAQHGKHLADADGGLREGQQQPTASRPGTPCNAHYAKLVDDADQNPTMPHRCRT